MELPDIAGITTDTELLIKCVNIWRMSGFNGVPPDPHEVALMGTSQQEVIIMANFIDFVRDEPERMAMIGDTVSLKDIH